MTELSQSEISSLLSAAHAAADVAKTITLSYFRSDRLNTENKAANGFDPVTRADREAEAAIRAVLAKLRPDDAILGEELGLTKGTSGLTWVLDPIDGTRGYISGTPTWGTLISVRDAAGPILGLIDQPYIGERFIGGPRIAEMQKDGYTTPLAVKSVGSLSVAILFTTFPEIGSEIERAAFHQLAAETRLTRYGMDCYAYALLASGQIDLVVEAGLHAYDIQAPIAVVTAAGGIVTDWQGKPVHDGGRVLAAASRDLHAAALEILDKAPAN
ncbi:MAG: inositol monophosphatase family protein [Paracoccaceae bacterium]